VLVVAGAALLAACLPVGPPPPPPPPPYQTTACIGVGPRSAGDYQWQHDVLRTFNTDFGAGDGGAPIALPDGRILWLFADTWTGFIRNGAMVAPYRSVHNAFVVQSGGCFTPILGGTHGARADLIPAPPGQFYWPMGAYVDGSVLRVFLMRFAPGSGICGCVALDIEIAKFSLPGLQLIGTGPSPGVGPLPEFGSAVYTAGGFNYFVGRNSPDGLHPRWQYLARVPIGTDPSTPGTWRYWNGGSTGTDSDWGLNGTGTPCTVDPNTLIGSGGACPMRFEMPGSATPTPEGPNSPLWVVPQPNGTFLASAKLADVLPDPINTWVAPTPYGPWVGRKFAANTPGPAGTFTYSGRVFQLPGANPTAQYSTAGPHTDWYTDTYKVLFATPAP
jgi:hypothetical protein